MNKGLLDEDNIPWLTPAVPEGITPLRVEVATAYLTPLNEGVPLTAALTRSSLNDKLISFARFRYVGRQAYRPMS